MDCDLKRLVALNSMGVYLTVGSCHVYLNCDAECESLLSLDLIGVNSKIYGGIVQALDVMDEALRRDGKPTLLERFEGLNLPPAQSLGLSHGVDESRLYPKGAEAFWLDA